MMVIRNYIRLLLLLFQRILYVKLYGMSIHRTARISFGTKLDKTNPKGIHIGAESYLASGAIIFTHDYARAIHQNTYIGERCFIGANAIIMCGITMVIRLL